jgi:hypothetical protein
LPTASLSVLQTQVSRRRARLNSADCNESRLSGDVLAVDAGRSHRQELLAVGDPAAASEVLTRARLLRRGCPRIASQRILPLVAVRHATSHESNGSAP